VRKYLKLLSVDFADPAKRRIDLMADLLYLLLLLVAKFFELSPEVLVKPALTKPLEDAVCDDGPSSPAAIPPATTSERYAIQECKLMSRPLEAFVALRGVTLC
jgi:hypothetical protein